MDITIKNLSLPEFGIMASQGKRQDGISYSSDLNASWVRINGTVDGSTVPYTQQWLQAGFNLILTLNYRVASNCNTSYVSLANLPKGGFPYKDRATYITHIQNYLNLNVIPYLNSEQKVIIQCENEVADITVAKKEQFWGGTSDQYSTQLNAFYQAVSPLGLKVSTTSVTSETVDAIFDPTNPNYSYQLSRVTKMLSHTTDYDYTDIHLYGCASNLKDRINAYKALLPAGKELIATEISGPMIECPTEYKDWHTDLNGFETAQASQVTQRLQACKDCGLAVSLWFSLFDLNGEVDDFNHCGLLTNDTSPRQKAAYNAFKEFTNPPIQDIIPGKMPKIMQEG